MPRSQCAHQEIWVGYIQIANSEEIARASRAVANTLLQWREFLGSGFSPYVFPSPRIPGRSLFDNKKAWQKAAREAGLPDRRIYDLRSTFASRANACRASGLTIAQLLGHATSTQILPTYVKPLDENTKAVIDALDAARSSRPGTLGTIQ